MKGNLSMISVDQISADYSGLSAVSNSNEVATGEDLLGRDAFLTMLVTQLQHQDPLSPMEGTDFTAQLAQFSTLESQFNTLDELKAIKDLLKEGSSPDLQDYIGKEVIGEIDAIEVANGSAFGGYYALTSPGNVVITIENGDGNIVKTLHPGQKEQGEYSISWDGKDDSGNILDDGSYKYSVAATDEDGMYYNVQTTVSGIVNGVVYNNGTGYLQVKNTFVRPESVIKISSSEVQDANDPMSFLGKTVEARTGVLDVYQGILIGEMPEFDLERADEVRVTIYDSSGDMVRTLDLGALDEGIHAINWNGKDDGGIRVTDGVYTYDVLTKGAYAETSISGLVDGIIYRNGINLLKIGEFFAVPVDVSTVS